MEINLFNVFEELYRLETQPQRNRHLKQTGETIMPQPQHKATYARDKMYGGYNIRVVGPQASKFSGREVPVTRKDNSESYEELESLLWSGTDNETGQPVALYSFVQKPKAIKDVEF